MAGVTTREPLPDPAASAEAPRAVPALPWHGSTERLLELAQSGAPAAAQLVHDRFADDIHRVVYRVLGPDAEHEDVVQQVFLQILRDVSRVREADKLQGWVMAVAVNTARALIRKRKLRFWHSTTVDDAETWTQEDDSDGRELVRRTYGILRQLRTEDRVAFSLRYIEGYQVQEVASLTGASLATVHRRLARGELEFRRRAAEDELLRERLARAEAARKGPP
jgi:RNA polymerase sigma-70 factor (ECF subfamily)